MPDSGTPTQALSLSTIKQLIADNTVGSDLKLRVAQWPSNSIQDMFIPVFGTERLTFFQPKTRVDTADELSVEAFLRNTFLGCINLKVALKFTMAANEYQLAMTFSQFPQSWKFSQAYGTLKGTLADSFQYHEVSFVFDSQKPSTLPSDYREQLGYRPDPSGVGTQIIQGIHFSASILTSTIPGDFKWLFIQDSTPSLTLSGPLEVIKDYPVMWLRSDHAKNITLFGKEIPLSLEVISIRSDDNINSQKGVTLSFGQAVATIPVTVDAAKHDIRFYGRFFNSEVVAIQVVADTVENGHGLSINDISNLIGGHDNATVFPDNFPASSLELLRMGTLISLDEQKPTEAFIGLGIDGKWEPFGDWLSFSDFRIRITTLLETASLYAVARTKVSLFNEILDATILLPDLDFNISLAQGQTIEIGEMLSQLSINIPGLSSTRCTRFTLSGNVEKSFYGVLCQLQDVWHVDLGAGTLAVEEISLQLNHSAEGNGAYLEGKIEIGTSEFQLIANHDIGATGWDLTGRTYDGSTVNLTAVVGGLLKLIGVNLPGQVPNITLLNLDLEYNTGTEALHLVGETAVKSRIPLGLNVHELDSKVDIKSAPDASTGKRTFTGMIEAYLTVGAAKFLLSYEMGAGKHKINGSWSTDADHTIGFGDIAGMLGITHSLSVPSGLDLGLEAIQFEYDVDNQQFMLSAKSKNYGQAFFVAGKGEDGSWGFVFGINLNTDTQLSNLPEVGPIFGKVAGVLSIKQTAIVLSTATFDNFTLPVLPSLDIATPTNQAIATGSNQTGNLSKPIVADTKLKLSEGLSIAAVIDFGSSSGPIVGNLHSIVKHDELVIQASVGAGEDLSIFAQLNGTVGIPTGKSSLELGNPAIKIDLTPTGDTFALSGDVDFNLSHEQFDATARMILSETEAQVAIELKSENGSLPSPPGLKGIHFEDLGIEMGVFFEPPGVDLGLTGDFRIGENPAGRDDSFGFVLEIVEEVPNPLYLSFYLEEISFGEVITVFTDKDSSAFPSLFQEIKATDVSFYWADSLVVLPDGTVAQPGFGFNGNIKIFAFEAHAGLVISVAQGINGLAEMSPIHLNGILDITGDSKGISQTYQQASDGTWNKVDNRQVNKLPEGTKTRTEVIVPPGGPQFRVSTTGSPYLDISWKITLFGLLSEEVEAVITNEGFLFKLEYKLSSIAKATLQCSLKDRDNFSAYARFSLDLDAHIGPIKILGIDFGTLHLDTSLSASMKVVVSPSEFSLAIRGSFEFEGLRLTLPELTLSVAPSSLADLPGLILKHIEDNAEEIFKDLFDIGKELLKDAEKLVEDIGKDAEKAAEEIAAGATEAAKKIGQAAEEAAADVEQAADAIAGEAEEVGEEAAHLATEAAEEVAKIGTEAVQEAEKIGKEAAAAVEAAAEEVSKIGEAAVKEVEELGKEAEEVLGEAEKEVAAIATAAAHEVEKILGDARHLAEEALAEARKLASAVAHEAEAVFNEAKHLAARAAAAISHVAHKVWHAISHY